MAGFYVKREKVAKPASTSFWDTIVDILPAAALGAGGAIGGAALGTLLLPGAGTAAGAAEGAAAGTAAGAGAAGGATLAAPAAAAAAPSMMTTLAPVIGSSAGSLATTPLGAGITKAMQSRHPQYTLEDNPHSVAEWLAQKRATALKPYQPLQLGETRLG